MAMLSSDCVSHRANWEACGCPASRPVRLPLEPPSHALGPGSGKLEPRVGQSGWNGDVGHSLVLRGMAVDSADS